MKPHLAALLAVAVAVPTATGQSTTVVPNAAADTVLQNSGVATFFHVAGQPRTAQMLITQTQLTAVPVGSQITGLAFRLPPSGYPNFPSTDATWAEYTIKVGAGVQMGAQTNTFASNFASAPTTVRTGPLTIPAGSFTDLPGSGLNPFGPPITYHTPYTYTGGNLLIEIRHTGSNLTAPGYIDCLASSLEGYEADQYWCATSNGYDATASAGGGAFFPVIQLQFTPVPEPATIGLIGAATLGVGAVVRRRVRSNTRRITPPGPF